MIFGWTPDYILKMPTPMFYALIKTGREYKERETARQELHFLDAIATGGIASEDYHNGLRNSLYYSAIGKPEMSKSNSRVLDATDPKTARILESIFKEAKRING